jgi:putative flavoprotein involved in K+ transport
VSRNSLGAAAASGEAVEIDVVVVGGGQAALAIAYYLRRTALSYVVLDAGEEPGGAWRQTWRSLRLFSPAQWSSLPGHLMPGGTGYYPTRDEALAYLEDYEARYAVPVVRPARVTAVVRDGDRLRVESSAGIWRARAVVSATGTWSAPNVPDLPGASEFRGRVIHSAHYRSAAELAGQRVIVVGGGNSGAQIVADLYEHATVTWATRREPTFLPDEIDGRYLFGEATARYNVLTTGRGTAPPRTLGDIVMVEPVRRARDAGVLRATPMFLGLTPGGVRWPDGAETPADTIVLATGFRPDLRHLASLAVRSPNGRVAVAGTRSVREPRLWLVGYGDWTGYASATLIGVGRSARSTVDEIVAALSVDGSNAAAD